jgi:hypothetical protein
MPGIAKDADAWNVAGRAVKSTAMAQHARENVDRPTYGRIERMRDCA